MNNIGIIITAGFGLAGLLSLASFLALCIMKVPMRLSENYEDKTP